MNGSTLATPSGYFVSMLTTSTVAPTTTPAATALPLAADGERDDDQTGADCVVGDGVEPRRE